MKQHKKLLEGMLLKESFELLKQEMSSKNSVEAIQYFKEYSDVYNSVEMFKLYVDKGNVVSYVNEFLTTIRTESYLESFRDRIQIFFPSETLDLFFAVSILGHNEENMKFILPFANKDLEQYPIGITNLIKEQNEDTLKYLINNMANIHYDNDILLSQCQSFSNDFLRFMIEEKGFSVNETNNRINTNFMTFISYLYNMNTMAFIVRNYNEQIDWRQPIGNFIDSEAGDKDGGEEIPVIERCLSIFAERDTETLYKFYRVMLNDNVKLRAYESARLLDFAKNNISIFVNGEGVEILTSLFRNHALYSEENQEMSGLLYNLFARFLNTIQVNRYSNDESAKNSLNYLNDICRFTQIYLKNRNPEFDEALYSSSAASSKARAYHPLGCGLFIHQYFKKNKDNILPSRFAEIEKNKDIMVQMIINEFAEDVNLVNPNGVLPIQQVEEGEREYTLLLQKGALPVETDTGFVKSLLNRVSGKKKLTVNEVISMEAANRAQRNRSKKREAKGADAKVKFGKLRDKLESSILMMIERAEKENSPEMIVKVLQEFKKKSVNILNLMIRQEYLEISEEVRWLSGNFTEYTEEALNSYWKLIDVARNTSDGEEMERKIVAYTDRVLIALTKVQKQLNISVKNIASEIEFSASNDLNLGNQFITETFEIEEKTLNQKMIKSHERAEKGISEANVSVFDDEDSVDLMKHTSDKKYEHKESSTVKSKVDDTNQKKDLLDNLFT